nr:acetyltransferase [Acidobacteriota bacterium]
VLNWCAERWVQFNDAIFDTFLTTRWQIRGLEGIRRDGHYLVISNHISWVDIFAAQRALRLAHAPLFRFFLKHTLAWSPLVGQAAWALEFPFMRRYSPEYLQQHPEKRGRDLETTRIACERYRDIPVTILNYVEGTRFSLEKQDEQQSPYRYLLRPRVGGIAFVLASMGDQLEAIYDLTVVYPEGDVTMLDFITNRLPWIHVEARRLEIPREFATPAVTVAGPERESFKVWVEELWREKDELIGRVRGRP